MNSPLRRLIRGRPIIVVSGLPRSGTSMVMRMLQAGGVSLFCDEQRRADAHNVGGYFEAAVVKTLGTGAGSGWLRHARGRAVKIVSPLLTHLPESYDYQVVFMRRDLDEVIASQNAMLDARQETDATEDARLPAHYEEHLRQVERFLARRACFSTLTVAYADVLAQPGEESGRIAAFLGGRLDVALMAAVADPALSRHHRAGRG
jgi:hypothetical protein